MTSPLKRDKFIEELHKHLTIFGKGSNDVCLHFSSVSIVGNFGHAKTITVGRYSLKFQDRTDYGLQIRKISNTTCLIITRCLIIDILPACKKISIETSNPTPSSSFVWYAYNSNKKIAGGKSPTHPPYTFDIIGDVDRLEFRGNNESGIYKICFYS